MLKIIKKTSFFTFLAVFVLAIGSYLRFFKLTNLLGFWYDQGRDALVIWDFIHKGKFFLIGPTTGIEGVFRGPWYYWLITPFYALGNGNPIFPSIFLILTSIFAIYILFKLGKEIGGWLVGLTASLIASVSVYIVGSSRWLSNPTPMLLIGISLVWAVFKFLEKKKWAMPLIAFLTGMALNFGSAMEVFYLPALIIIFIWKRKLLPGIKTIILSAFVFLSVFLPQILFEIRHPGVLSGPLVKFLFQENSFSLSVWELLQTRLAFYYSVFYSKFWPNGPWLFAPFLILAILILVIQRKKIISDAKTASLLIFSITPFLGGLFFSGNHGNIYDYYFTGYYLIFILLFSYLITRLSGNKFGKIVLTIFLAAVLYKNFSEYKNTYIIQKNNRMITLGMQLRAIDWIYKDAVLKEFNVDEYVPPVIPYAYQYLFQWLGETKYKSQPLIKNTDLLYTLYEVDFDHPERLKAWLERQAGIGKVNKEEKFGNVVVQQRQRILFTK